MPRNHVQDRKKKGQSLKNVIFKAANQFTGSDLLGKITTYFFKCFGKMTIYFLKY